MDTGGDAPNFTIDVPDAYRKPWPGSEAVKVAVPPGTGQGTSAAAAALDPSSAAASRVCESGASSNGKLPTLNRPGSSCPNVLPPKGPGPAWSSVPRLASGLK